MFTATLNQILYLILLIFIGYFLTKIRVLDRGAAVVLSKLENNIFVPAMMFGTFLSQFTVEKLGGAGRLLLVSSILVAVMLPVAILLARVLSRDDFTRKIVTYGLTVANFGFMGISVIGALFPQYSLDYMIFIIPLYVVIYAWAVPVLLIGGEGKGIRARLRSFCNPMFAAMLLGAIFGLVGVELPSFLGTAVDTLGACMSPLAMVLTGITVACIPPKRVFGSPVAYFASAIRLLAIPLVFLFLLRLFPLSESEYVCAVCTLAMPLGLNPVVIPSAYGKDTTVAACMALVSHLLSAATIPLIFWLMQMQIG